MKYDLDYFIAKFEAIPESKWTTGMYIRDDGTRCAVGHCNPFAPDDPERQALFGISTDIMIINDGINELANYAPTPKQRVLKHLRALKYMEGK